jgi:mRNA-degrading endonuclease RelE of RelBE toxin-antitoxin system
LAFNVLIEEKVRRQIEKLPRDMRARIIDTLKELE